MTHASFRSKRFGVGDVEPYQLSDIPLEQTTEVME